MNWFKILSSDYTIGKLLTLRKAAADSIRLLVSNPSRESFELARLMFMVKPSYTMVTNANLILLYQLVQTINRLGLPGDLVECGVWNGGSAAVLSWANNKDTLMRRCRTLWLFDSFQGLPPPTVKDGTIEQVKYFEGWCKGDINKVRRILGKVGTPLDLVRIVPGWFEATLDAAQIDRIAILHIDADWYNSVKLVLDSFYDKVIPGGFIVLNDYGYWDGCNQALSDFFLERHLKGIEIIQVDPYCGAYMQKPFV